jgi:hypothetical protein
MRSGWIFEGATGAAGGSVVVEADGSGMLGDDDVGGV